MSGAGMTAARTAATATTQLYVDMMSQPSRACVLLCRMNKLDVQEVAIKLHKKEQRAPEYREMNALAQVPCLVERNPAQNQAPSFVLAESCAILKYICKKYDLASWCWNDNVPLDAASGGGISRREAYVDSALHWYHSTLRKGCAGFMFHKVLAKNLGAQPVEAIAADSKLRLSHALKQLETVWLHGENRFVGGRSMCVADLLFACELEQLQMLHRATDGTDMEEILHPFPNVCRWMSAVASSASPVYGEVHAILDRASQRRHDNLNKSKL